MIVGRPRYATINGVLTHVGYIVHVGDMPLDPADSQAVHNHSPDGFSWGHGGSGAAQLSLAILLHYADRTYALRHYQEFKAAIVSCLPPVFTIRERAVHKWIKEHQDQYSDV
jgi:hypothetical protein